MVIWGNRLGLVDRDGGYSGVEENNSSGDARTSRLCLGKEGHWLALIGRIWVCVTMVKLGVQGTQKKKN